jgi:hypothetical protein
MTRATHGANLKLNTVPALKWAGGIDRRPGWELARGPCECTGGSRMSDRNGDSETHVYTPSQAASSGLRPGPGSGPAPVARLRVGIGNLNLNLAPLPASVHIALGASEASQAASFALHWQLCTGSRRGRLGPRGALRRFWLVLQPEGPPLLSLAGRGTRTRRRRARG